MTFAWETEAFKHGEQLVFGPRKGGGDRLADTTWPWVVYDDIYQSGVFSDWIIGTLSIPMGSGGRATVVSPGAGLPPVVQTTIGGSPSDISGPIDKRDIQHPSTASGVRVRFQDYQSWGDFQAAGHSLPGDYDVYANPADYVAGRMKPKYQGPQTALPQATNTTIYPGNVVVNTPPINPSSEPPPMDLGSVFGDLILSAGQAYINKELGMNNPTVTNFVDNTPDVLPGVDIVSQSPGKDYIYKQVCGQWKWVKKRKRRCKRLLTDAQARDLQTLMSIAGKSSELTKIIVAKGGIC